MTSKETNIEKDIEIAVEHIKRDKPVDLHELASDLGLKVKKSFDLEDDIAGMIECDDNDTHTIFVNALQHPNRQRFTLAHEIGHFLLHRSLIGDGLDDTKAYRSTDAGKYYNGLVGPQEETEANKFAASALMPSHLIDKYQEEGITEASELAKKLQVSEQAMKIRLANRPQKTKAED